MRRKSLELIILIPVLIFLILAGASFYFSIYIPLENFLAGVIKDNLSSMSMSLHSIADKKVDELDIKGFSDDKERIKIGQVDVLMEIENFARQNDIDIIVYDLNNHKIIFRTRRIPEDAEKIVSQIDRQRNQIISIPDKGTFYFRSIEFKPWEWRMILAKDASAFSSLIKKIRNFYLAICIILLLVDLFLIVYLRRAIGQPINQIVGSIKKEKFPEYKGISQLEYLSESITQFMKEIQKYRDHLEDLVRARTAELEEANQAKSRAIAMIAHQMKNPLTPIVGFTKLVMQQCKDILPAKQYENLQAVMTNCNRLFSLIDLLLNFSRIENGQMPITRINFSLGSLIDECLQTIELKAKETGLQLLSELEEYQLPLYTDKEKVKQILNNLLNNAVKFTEKGTITIAAQRCNEKIHISVADTGIGISKKDLGYIFKEFIKGNNNRYPGTGLGLAYSIGLARLLGGDISVESIEGMGSTFTLTIPIYYPEGQFD